MKTMKKIFLLTCLSLLVAFNGLAQDSETATQRANRLSDQMIRDLKLNNFQANRLRAINQEKVNKMVQIENKYASDEEAIDKNCQGVCKERDKELMSFLSSDQYSQYFSSRALYYKSDKDFAAQIGAGSNKTAKSNKTELPIGKKVVPVQNKSQTILKPSDSK